MKLRNFAVAVALVLSASLSAGVADASPLSAARSTSSKNGGAIKRYLMKASTTIYAGGLVMLDSNGLALPAAASASNKGVVGVSLQTKTSAASGNYYIEAQEGWFLLDATSIANTALGGVVFASDDHTIDETQGSNEPLSGLLIEVVSSTSGWVHVSPIYIGRLNLVSDPLVLTTDLTMENGGTISNSVNNSFVFGENSEDVKLAFTSNILTLSSSTGVNSLVFGALAPTFQTVITATNGGTLSNETNNSWILSENSESLSFDFTSNAVALSSSTGVATFTLPSTIALAPVGGISTSIANGANAACDTTCNTKKCITGFDAGASAFVACATATADTCLCGP